MEKLQVTWEEFDDDVSFLKKEILKIDNPHLVTLVRGGLPLGVSLSNKLGLPLSLIDFQTRDGKYGVRPKAPRLIKNDGYYINQTFVLIDDIFDLGLTLAKSVDLLRDTFPNCKIKIFTLYQNDLNQHLHKNYPFEVTSLHNSKVLF